MKNRIFAFGKYKGQEVKVIILSHIGYIMWCLENIKQFRLTDEEQAIYDAVAIMIRKENCQMTFPTEAMYRHVKDKKSLELLRTPLTCINGYTFFKKSDRDNPIYESVKEYIARRKQNNKEPGGSSVGGLRFVAQVMNSEIERAHLNGERDEDIFWGCSNMSDYD